VILIIPAVEIRAGRCVRTAQGVGELCYSDDPVEVARLWRIENAKSLHVTDLDGVREGRLVNAESVKRMVQTVDIPVELGGGVRTFEDARWAFETGVYRVLVSTMVIENPEEAQRLLSVYGPSKVVLAMYAVHGIVATHGGATTSGLTALSVALNGKNGAILVFEAPAGGKAAIELMQKPEALKNGEKRGYAFGLVLGKHHEMTYARRRSAYGPGNSRRQVPHDAGVRH